MLGIVYSFLSWEVSTISWLQSVFANIGLLDAFYFFNFLGDPKYCFMMLSPLGFIFSRKLGESTLVMAALSEHVNTMLKWLTFGPRPYWWGQAFMPAGSVPTIQQWPLTCETGPGFPSGHVMVSMVTYFVLISCLIRHYGDSRKHMLGIILAYCFGIFCIALARLLLAAHFVHQVVIGTFVGVFICKIAYSTKLIDRVRSETIMASLLVLFTGAIAYACLWLIGYEPTWTEEYALKYCSNKEWVRMETSTLYSLVRDSSSLVGIWLIRHVAERVEHLLPSDNEIEFRTKLLSCFVILPGLFLFERSFHFPPAYFYQVAFVYWSLLPVVVWLFKSSIVLAENIVVKTFRGPLLKKKSQPVETPDGRKKLLADSPAQ